MPPKKTRAPQKLTPIQLQRLRQWAEEKVPWISRGCFESFTTLDAYVEEVLEYWTGTGGLKVNWLATVRNWIRRKERDRLERIARAGNAQAVLALREPADWVKSYDGKASAVERLDAATSEEKELIRPSGGVVVQIAGRIRTQSAKGL